MHAVLPDEGAGMLAPSLPQALGSHMAFAEICPRSMVVQECLQGLVRISPNLTQARNRRANEKAARRDHLHRGPTPLTLDIDNVGRCSRDPPNKYDVRCLRTSPDSKAAAEPRQNSRRGIVGLGVVKQLQNVGAEEAKE